MSQKIFNKTTVQVLDSYFIVNAKENSDVTDSTFAYEKGKLEL